MLGVDIGFIVPIATFVTSEGLIITFPTLSTLTILLKL